MASSRRVRAPLALALACALASAARAEPTTGESVRVLLREDASVVRVNGTRLEASRGGIRAGGRRVGASWTAGGTGPHDVDGLRVRGVVRATHTAGGLQLINQVGLEDYVAGTLGREMYASWHPEALKAQAVVTRTYALHRRAQRREAAFDLVPSTADQVYGGVAAEDSRIRVVVQATVGEHLRFRGEPILAVFHSASGGHTASASEVWGEAVPYLLGRPVPNEEDSPDTYWRARVTGTTLGRALAPLGIRLGVVRGVRIVSRSPSGRAERLRVEGTRDSSEITGRALRTALGEDVIRSTLFEIREIGNRGNQAVPGENDSMEPEFVIVGSGFGHGVGMSQWGAEAMARRGASYRAILRSFYPGTRLSREAVTDTPIQRTRAGGER